MAFVEGWVSVVTNDLFSWCEIVEELKTQLCSGPNRQIKSQYRACTSSLKQVITLPKLPSFPPATKTPVPVTPGRCALMFYRIIRLQKLLGWKTELLLCRHEPIYSGSAATQPERRDKMEKSTVLASHPIKTALPTAQLSQHIIGGEMLVSKSPVKHNEPDQLVTGDFMRFISVG